MSFRSRQPVHTMYGGAHLFRATLVERLSSHAVGVLDRYASSAAAFSDALDPGKPADPVTTSVYEQVRAKLRREPVEDYRIDFEDGYGVRPDSEEDAAAASVGREVATAQRRGVLPPFWGIRIKSLQAPTKKRALRTLQIFVDTLRESTESALGEITVTLPKVTDAGQVEALAIALERLEVRAGWSSGSMRMELMVETPQAVIGEDGRCPLRALVGAASGRCRGVHFGTYDYTAACGVAAVSQAMDHPLCLFALATMQTALAGTGVSISDGATTVLPVPPHRGALEQLSVEKQHDNRDTIHRAWRCAYANNLRSLHMGIYQGWDVHPAQLPARFAANYVFFRSGFASAAERLRGFLDQAAQATRHGQVFDDAATGEGLLNFFLRARDSGAIDPAEIESVGLNVDELELRSFPAIVAARQQR